MTRPFPLLDCQAAYIIKHSGYDSFEAATKVVCDFLLYVERLAMLINKSKRTE